MCGPNDVGEVDEVGFLYAALPCYRYQCPNSCREVLAGLRVADFVQFGMWFVNGLGSRMLSTLRLSSSNTERACSLQAVKLID